MKLKKAAALLMSGLMVFSLTACGGNSGEDKGSVSTEDSTATEDNTSAGNGEGADKDVAGSADAKEKLVVWTLAEDLKEFADHYVEKNPQVQIETVVIAPADYPTKVQTAMRGKQTTPDIIVGEPQQLTDMYEAGYFEDLDQEPYNAQEYADKIVDYVWDVGKDADGIQRAISYQITPSGIFYRRDIAKEVFGTEDPDEISKLFGDYNTIKETGQKLKDAGYKIFASDQELAYSQGNGAWVQDGKLVVDEDRQQYMDLCVDLYQNDMTAYVAAWSGTWYQGMGGSIPVIDASTNVWDEAEMEKASADGDTTEIFAYGLPAWGITIMRDHVNDLSGKWGICAGPSYGFGGGTFIGISALSEHKELAWDFVKFCTLTEETSEWWIKQSEGDVVSYLPSLEKHKDDENSTYGGQKLFQFFLEQAEGIDYSKVTKYDQKLNEEWSLAINSIKTGEKTKEDALNNFYDIVQSTYPELEVDR